LQLLSTARFLSSGMWNAFRQRSWNLAVILYLNSIHNHSILFSLIKNRAVNFYTCTSEKTARSHDTLFSRSDCWPESCNFVGIRYFRGIHAAGRFIIYSVLHIVCLNNRGLQTKIRFLIYRASRKVSSNLLPIDDHMKPRALLGIYYHRSSSAHIN
jgi:hypothetical protein